MGTSSLLPLRTTTTTTTTTTNVSELLTRAKHRHGKDSCFSSKFLKITQTQCHLTGSIREASLECVQQALLWWIFACQNIVVRGENWARLVWIIKRHLKPVVCVCYRAPYSRADRLTASSHNTPLTLCGASRSTRTDQRREAGDVFGVFSPFPSSTFHFFCTAISVDAPVTSLTGQFYNTLLISLFG